MNRSSPLLMIGNINAEGTASMKVVSSAGQARQKQLVGKGVLSSLLDHAQLGEPVRTVAERKISIKKPVDVLKLRKYSSILFYDHYHSIIITVVIIFTIIYIPF